MYTLEEKQFILNLAREAISYFLTDSKILKIDESRVIFKKLLENKACFVTLKINGELRGCVGHIEPTQPLYLDIIENAVGSAFRDSRFDPLTPKEFEQISMEVSVLTEPVQLFFDSSADLLNKIRPNIDGVIIQKDGRSATYLPAVWNDFESKEKFLSSLCVKAGLKEGDWLVPDLLVWTYQVESIE